MVLEKYQNSKKLCEFIAEYNLMDNDGIEDSLDDVGTSMGLQSDLRYTKNKALQIVKTCDKSVIDKIKEKLS